jgi:hypothetical protein
MQRLIDRLVRHPHLRRIGESPGAAARRSALGPTARAARPAPATTAGAGRPVWQPPRRLVRLGLRQARLIQRHRTTVTVRAGTIQPSRAVAFHLPAHVDADRPSCLVISRIVRPWPARSRSLPARPEANTAPTPLQVNHLRTAVPCFTHRTAVVGATPTPAPDRHYSTPDPHPNPNPRCNAGPPASTSTTGPNTRCCNQPLNPEADCGRVFPRIGGRLRDGASCHGWELARPAAGAAPARAGTSNLAAVAYLGGKAGN